MEPLRGIGIGPGKVAREESLPGAPGYDMKAFLVIEKGLLRFLRAECCQPAVGYRRGRHDVVAHECGGACGGSGTFPVQWNCSRSVEPSRAVVELSPPAMTCATSSK